jgi:phosphatidylglycerophosphatase A
MNRFYTGFIVWLAQGFGVGRVPMAPGTFGTLPGLVWFAVILALGNIWLAAIAMMAGFAISIIVCGEAERILRQPDPGSVVLDEIVAVPLCFAGPVMLRFIQTGALPAPDYFFSREQGLILAIGFALFRLFDIWKPWPVRQSQKFPGGWGITIDDLLAAVYVTLILTTLVTQGV